MSGPQLEVKRTFLEFDLHAAAKIAGQRRSFSAGHLQERNISRRAQAPCRCPCKCDDSDIEISSTSAGSSRSRTPSPNYSHAASPRRCNGRDNRLSSVPTSQPCFFWFPVIAFNFNPQQNVASGVTAALQAKKAEFGSTVAQLAEASLQAEAAMEVVKNEAWRARGLASRQHQAPAVNTTIMLRNVPRWLTRTMLLAELESQGFAGKFDFVYLPVDFEESTRCGQNFGHAFINFVRPHDAARARECFEGFVAWAVENEKPCEAVWREQCQGLAAHIKKYRNSALMHASVPDENKPVMFADGVRCPFPAPTQPINAPKLRRSPGGS